jgi:GTP1/Obg family GTP-binding protein
MNIFKYIRKLRFRNVIRKRRRKTKSIVSYTNGIRNLIDKIRIAGGLDEKIIYSGSNLCDLIDNICVRFDDLQTTELEIGYDEDANLQLLQNKFRNELEAFHQQVYAVLSALSDFLKRLPGVKSAQISGKSNKKFLEYLLSVEDAIKDDICILESSRKYRSELLDHINVKPFTWITFFDPETNQCFMVYLIEPNSGANVFMPEYVPYPKDIPLALTASQIVVPQHHRKVFIALNNVVIETLRKYEKNKHI